MSKIIELTRDLWTYGCKGDVITVTDDQLENLDKISAQTSETLYKPFTDTAKRVEKAVEGEVVKTDKTPTDTAEATDPKSK